MIRKTACFVLLIILTLLTGCWDNRPVPDLSIVTGVGIDRSADDKIEITLQIINKSGSHGSSFDSFTSKKPSSTVTVGAKGDTIFEAVNNLKPSLGEMIYFTHVQLMAIGEDAAKEGFEPIWDYFERDHEMGSNFSVLVVKNGTSKSVLEAEPETEMISAVQIAKASEQKTYGENVGIRSFEVTELLGQPLTGIVTGVIDAGEAKSLKDMKVEGGAVFKHGKLVGYLDNNEARGLLFASGKIKNAVLTIANSAEEGKRVSIEVISSACKLKAVLTDGKPKFSIEVTASGNIGEEQGGVDLTDRKKVKALVSETVAVIEDSIRATIKKSQKELDSDILNFNDRLYKHDYHNFVKIKDNWEELYRDADFSITVDFLIEKSGVIKKPAFVISK